MSLKTTQKALENILALADIQVNGQRPWDMQILDDRTIMPVLNKGSMGLGETYMKHWWDCEALDQFSCKILKADLESKVKSSLRTLLIVLKSRLINLQSTLFAKQVAQQHYNLSNALFTRMLGSSMAYSCGYWKNASTLDEAQYAKYDLICKKLQLLPKERVLDIGCGWGGLASHIASKYGCEVVALSNSKPQIDFAKQNFGDLPIEFYHTDYRNHRHYNPNAHQFDKIVSVGFFEHVGYKNYQRFFRLVEDQLKNSGLFLLHTIGGNLTLYNSDPWMNKYIFPHGMLPSMQQASAALEPYFIMEDWHNFGPDYDNTLMAWHANFEAHWDEIKDQFDMQFYYMWRYYLLMCAGLFRARSAQLWQIVLSKPGFVERYNSVR